MVLKPTRRSPRITLQNLAIFIVCLLTSYTATRFLIGQTLTEFVQNNIISVIKKNKKPEFISLQQVVEDWAKENSGKVSVMIYDLDNDAVSAVFNQDEKMPTASLYKLYVAYEEYRRIDNEELSPSDIVYKKYTRSQCLDLMIRESHSPCAETLWDEIGRDNINKILKTNYGLKDTESLTSTAADLTKLLQIYYRHAELSDESWNTIKDSMLNQPITNGYDWRQGLPSGFSEKINVYNKVGWDAEDEHWKIYNDAAILEIPSENRHLSAVVLTNNIEPEAIRNLATAIEEALKI